MRIATWNVRTLYRAGAMREMVKEMDKYKIDICALQEIRWPGTGTVINKNYVILYSGNKSDKHEFGTGFYISRRNMDNLLDFEPINERMCKIRIKLKYCNLTLILTHAPTEDKDEVVKEDFDNCLEKTCDAIPNYDMKIILGDFNSKVGKETYLHPACGGHSLHNETNDNGKRMVKFALGKDLAVTGTWFQHKDIHKITWRSRDNKICNQIDHILVDKNTALMCVM
jgi:exonuclease III